MTLPDTPRDDLALFEACRDRLFGLAYRMLGTVSDAEDIVQTAFLRWQERSTEPVQAPQAYLTRIVTRLAIDALRTAERERRQYPGPWLAEPLPPQIEHAGEAARERKDTLSLGFLWLLEQLTAQQRAVFVLREALELSYAEIAETLAKSEGACRQAYRRAKARIGTPQPQPDDATTARDLVERFLEAAARGDQDTLVDLLAPEARLVSDGGGEVVAARNPIHGADAIARFVLGVVAKSRERLAWEIWPASQRATIVVWIDDALQSIWSLTLAETRIAGLYGVANPDKLQPFLAPRGG